MASDDSGMRARKPKLAVKEQIAHLKSKGVTFDLCSEGEAAECLSDRTYYFKLAAYRVLFDKRVGGERDGEYVGLDFGHLRDLAAIDHMLRYTLLPTTASERSWWSTASCSPTWTMMESSPWGCSFSCSTRTALTDICVVQQGSSAVR